MAEVDVVEVDAVGRGGVDVEEVDVENEMGAGVRNPSPV